MKNRLKPGLCCGQEKVNRWQHLSLGQETQFYDTSITCLVGFWRCLLRACRVKILGCYIADTAKKSVSYSIVLYSLPLAVGRYKKNLFGKNAIQSRSWEEASGFPFLPMAQISEPPISENRVTAEQRLTASLVLSPHPPALGLTFFLICLTYVYISFWQEITC